MSFVHGKNSIIKVGGTDISAYVTKVGFKPASGSGETTTLGKNSKTFIPGLKDCSIQVEFKWDSALMAILVAAWATISTWEYGPAGGGSGAVKLSGSGIVQGFPFDSDVGAPIGGSFDIQVTGDVTVGTYT